MAEFTFDATQVEPSTAFEVIPAGKYHVQIVNSEMRATLSGNGQYLWLELSIMDGPCADRRLFERLNLVNPNEKAVDIAQRRLGDICRAIGQLNRVHFENHGYVGPQSGKALVRCASGPSYQTTVSKVDAI